MIVQTYKHETYKKFEELKRDIGADIKYKLEQHGIIEERVVSALVDKLTKNIRGPDGGSPLHRPRMEYLMNSHKANHERTPLLISSIIEMKM